MANRHLAWYHQQKSHKLKSGEKKKGGGGNKGSGVVIQGKIDKQLTR